jgi:RNA polymerase sigma factor (sigma-70 family)
MSQRSHPSELFEQNTKLAHYWANRYVGRGAELVDLTETAMLYLWEASLKYDPVNYPGVPFSAFARTGLRRALRSAVAEARSHGITDLPDGVRQVNLPVELLVDDTLSEEMHAAVWSAVNRLEWPLMELTVRRHGMDGRAPASVQECANEFGLSVAKTKRLLSRSRFRMETELIAAGWVPPKAIEITGKKIA